MVIVHNSKNLFANTESLGKEFPISNEGIQHFWLGIQVCISFVLVSLIKCIQSEHFILVVIFVL